MRPGILRFPLPGWMDPAIVFSTLYADSTDVVWLDSGTGAAHGTSYMGIASRVIRSDQSVERPILEILREELAEAAPDVTRDGEPTRDGANEGFTLGWVGWLGYEGRFDTLGLPRTQPSRYPDAAFLYVDRAVAVDHGSSTISLIARGERWEGDLADWRDEVAAALAAAAHVTAASAVGNATAREPAQAPPEATPTPSHSWRYSDAEYLGMIEQCQRAIAAGEAYQLCLTTEVSVPGTPDPLATYLALRAASPTHHGGYLRIGDVALLSSSPEIFLTVGTDRWVSSLPIKGTRPRGSSFAEDERLRAELVDSEKERAENLMIVDLMRNDIGRVSEVGTVEVTSLLAVESYAQVHQLVSTVRGRLRADLDPLDAVLACFPAGSMTGAPKRNATVILDRLERRSRGIYSGAFGYFGLDGRIDLAMVIRSIVIDPQGATIGSGGGITALSDPEDELAEVKLKARALLGVLGVQ